MSTPLHVVSEHDHLEIAKILLAKGAMVDIKNIDGKVCEVKVTTHCVIIQYTCNWF